ncbi:MAG: lipopolysaccharide biosynthesis protein [Sphingomicrobium sp.]
MTDRQAGAEVDALAPARAIRGSVFMRMGRNIGWLLGGRGFAGVVSLAYLAIAARAMGPDRFGTFTLILTYGQLIANLVQFQSWKGVIRFGALHLAENRPDRLARLVGFTATLDAASALIGAALAVLGVHLAGPLLHWSAEEQNRAALFGAVLLLSTGATATGMLRLVDRFDLLTMTEAVAPLVRLIGAIGVWALNGGVVAFLTVWAIAALAQAIAGWVAVMAIHGSRLSIGRSAFTRTVGENPRIWRFMWQTNLSNSLSMFWMQTGTLAVGAVAGPAAAGGFRIADRIARGIAKPVETITRALYPELARLVASNDRATLIAVFKRITWIAASLALVLVVIAGLGGSLILRLVAGPQFAFAHFYLFLLAIAAAIDLTGFALEPFHNAHGRAGRVLRSRAVGAAVYALLLAVLLPTVGATGAAIAAIVTSIVIFVQLALSARQLLARPLESGTPQEVAAASLESGVDAQP